MMEAKGNGRAVLSDGVGRGVSYCLHRARKVKSYGMTDRSMVVSGVFSSLCFSLPLGRFEMSKTFCLSLYSASPTVCPRHGGRHGDETWLECVRINGYFSNHVPLYIIPHLNLTCPEIE
jgi:hypothetical protein